MTAASLGIVVGCEQVGELFVARHPLTPGASLAVEQGAGRDHPAQLLQAAAAGDAEHPRARSGRGDEELLPDRRDHVVDVGRLGAHRSQGARQVLEVQRLEACDRGCVARSTGGGEEHPLGVEVVELHFDVAPVQRLVAREPEPETLAEHGGVCVDPGVGLATALQRRCAPLSQRRVGFRGPVPALLQRVQERLVHATSLPLTTAVGSTAPGGRAAFLGPIFRDLPSGPVIRRCGEALHSRRDDDVSRAGLPR